MDANSLLRLAAINWAVIVAASAFLVFSTTGFQTIELTPMFLHGVLIGASILFASMFITYLLLRGGGNR